MTARFLFVAAVLLGISSSRPSFADPADAGAELQGAGSASAPAPAPSEQAADKLHDPVSSPAAAYDDVKAAKKVGWPLAVLAALVLLCRLAARAGGVFSSLGKGKVAVVIGAAGALSVSAYNAIASGGSWMAALLVAIVAAATYWDSKSKVAA